MAITKVINDLADLNQSGSTNALKGCAGITAEQPASSSSIDYLIVGGGGGNGTLTGGAGAGGLLTGTTTVYHGTPTVLTIGEGGPAGPASYPDPLWARNGDDSGFNGIRALGGGSGGGHGNSNNGIDGGSGGGATSSNSLYSGGSGTTGQGMGGGVNSTSSSGYGAGGGGGAGNPAGTANGAGGDGTSALGGTGGCGTNMSSFISSTNANLAQIGDVSGSDVFFAGGGGGGIQEGNTGGTPFGGPTYPAYANGGGGHGAADGNASQAGLRNTGGGAGGPGYKTSLIWGAGADGGSGVGVLKYNNTEVTGYTLNSEDTYTVNWPADKYGVAYWPLNLDVKDVGGYYDGTATDITYTNGQFNQAASFNGSTSHIDISAGLGTSGDRTRAMWINISNTPPPSTGDTLYYLGDSSSNAYYESLLYQETAGASTYKIKWHDRYNTVDDDILYSTTEIATDVWYHVAIVRDGTTQKMYINGSLDNSRTNTYSIVDTTAYPLIIGSWRAATCCFYEGLIEQVRFYTGALGDSDILDIYNNSKPGSLPPLKTSSDLTYNVCDYPSSSGSQGLFIFDGNITDTCSNITFTAASNGSLVSSYGTGKFASQSALWNGTQSSSGNTMETSYAWLSNSGAFTISLWVKYEEAANPAYQSLLWGNTSDWGTHGGILIYIYGASNSSYPNQVGVTFAASTGLGSPTWREYFTIPGGWANNWVHLATSQDSAGLKKMYINGIKVDEDTSAVTTIGEYDLTFGGYNGYTNDKFKGDMSNLRIYNESLSDQHVYDLWQKENSIQTYFPDTPTSGTDTLVFKEGSGEITFKNDSPPGAEVGMLRYNTTLDQMEHFNSGGWKDFTNCTTSICNYPTTARCLYTFNGDIIDACGNTTPDYLTGIYYTAGKFGQGFRALGPYSSFGYSRIGWSSGLGVDYNTSDFSISLWLKQYSYASYSACSNNALCYGYIFSGWSNSYWTLATDQTVAGNTIAWKSWGPGAGQIQTAESGIVDLNTWYHIVCTRSTTDGIQLWLNNQLVASVSGSWTAGTASVYDMIGGYGDTGYTRQGLNGSISQFRLFESVLTPEQISQLYNEVYCP
tara:strand:- start:1813 stop:5049 length:3237 start_codon:yes stop_codon:yes gene_type:complete